MRSIAAFLTVTALFVGINAACAGALLAAFTLGKWLVPDLMEVRWVVVPLALACVAGTLWLSFKATAFISRRLSQGPARGPGSRPRASTTSPG